MPTSAWVFGLLSYSQGDDSYFLLLLVRVRVECRPASSEAFGIQHVLQFTKAAATASAAAAAAAATVAAETIAKAVEPAGEKTCKT